MRTCLKCNFQVENDKAKFCKRCGTPLPLSVKSMDKKPTHLKSDNDISLNSQQSHIKFEQNHERAFDINSKTLEHVISDGYKSNKNYVINKNMMWAVKTCFQKYATLKGRASRSEYWYFIQQFNNIDHNTIGNDFKPL